MKWATVKKFLTGKPRNVCTCKYIEAEYVDWWNIIPTRVACKCGGWVDIADVESGKRKLRDEEWMY